MMRAAAVAAVEAAAAVWMRATFCESVSTIVRRTFARAKGS